MQDTLTGTDYRALDERWINMSWAEAAGLVRVDNFRGAELVGGAPAKRDHAGIWIPYRVPAGVRGARGVIDEVTSGRLRRDHPEVQKNNRGELKPKNKYLSATGDRNHLYFPPKTPGSALDDSTLPIIVTEGEFKSIALRRLASYNMPDESLRFLPIGLSGVWNWQGKIGTVEVEDGTRVDEHGEIPDLSFVSWAERAVIIAFDADLKSNAKVRFAREKLSRWLMSQGARVGSLEWKLVDGGKEAKGVDDWLHRDGPEKVLAAIATVKYVDGGNWRSRLITTYSGQVKPLLENARIALSESEEWSGKLTFDTFQNRLYAQSMPWNPEGGVWSDRDDVELACWLQRNKIEVGKEIARSAVTVAAQASNMALDWMRSLVWDGTPRIDTWLQDYMMARTNRDGVDITAYVSAVGRAWLVGGAARLIEPGCKMDYCLIFFGKEGEGKSTALKIMANGWFSDSVTDISSSFAPVLLSGKWIIEFAELQGWSRADKRVLKGWLSRDEDNYRPPHGTSLVNVGRSNICAGTTNEPEWLDDDGGEDRRMWGIEVMSKVDTDGLRAVRDQLWAEARVVYESGEKPYISNKETNALASQERDSYRQRDVWYGYIVDWLDTHVGDIVTTEEILEQVVKKDRQHMTQMDKVRVSRILRSIGYEPHRFGTKRRNGWRLPDDQRSLIGGDGGVY